jgi:hypothetical protein
MARDRAAAELERFLAERADPLMRTAFGALPGTVEVSARAAARPAVVRVTASIGLTSAADSHGLQRHCEFGS